MESKKPENPNAPHLIKNRNKNENSLPKINPKDNDSIEPNQIVPPKKSPNTTSNKNTF
jgi:hypothetical protein